MDDDSDSSSDESFASSYNSYDSSYGSYSSSDSGYTNSTNLNTGTDGGGSTAASSEIQEQHENVLAEEKVKVSVLSTLAGPPHTADEHEQLQMLVPSDRPGSGQDQCHL